MTNLAVDVEAIPVELPELADRSARYGVYVLDDEGAPRRLAECEQEALGTCLVQLADDRLEAGEVAAEVFGVLDQEERRWISGLWGRSL